MADGVDIDLYADDLEQDFAQVCIKDFTICGNILIIFLFNKNLYFY